MRNSRLPLRESHPDYLGTSSNWSFTRRVLNLTHSQVCNSPAPPQALIFDGGVYEIDWGRLKMGSDDPNLLPELPTLDHAIFLINTVQFNCCQLFHLFDTAEFMESCHEFYANPTPDIASAGLWYIHFCLVIALGKAFQSRRHGNDDVNCPLPKFDGQMQRMATLEMQVKLCRNIADINKR
ncbi:hypothetical protein ACHAP6_001152 [Verticillium nonalfalfae]